MFWLLLNSAFTVSQLSLSPTLPCSPHPPYSPREGAGGGQEVGRDTDRTADPNQTDQRDILCHIMACSAIKAQEKEDKAGKVMVTALFFPSNHYMY